MTKKTIYYLIAAVSALSFVGWYLQGFCNVWSGSSSIFCVLWFWLALLSIPIGPIFLFLAFAQRSTDANYNTEKRFMYQSVNPSILLIIGALMFLAAFFDEFIGLNLSGIKNFLYIGAVILLSAGFFNFFKGARG